MFQFNASQLDDNAAVVNGHKPGSASALNKSEKRQITRNRTSYSCVTCRRRKVKCDKVHPVCGGCEKAGEQCLYSDDVPNPGSQTAKSQQEDGPLWKKRKSSLAGVNSTDMLTSSALGFDNNIPSTDLKAIEEQLQRLTHMVDALRNGNANEENLRLKELLTPDASSSESGSDRAQPRPSLSLDMFQANNHGSAGEPADLSTPLSTLKIGHSELRGEDPFWSHISDELDQLNHLMRRRDNTYASSIGPQNKECDRPRNQDHLRASLLDQEKDNSCIPNDFHKEAGLPVLESLDPNSSESLNRLMAFGKASLLQSVPLICPPAAAVEHVIQGLPTRVQSNVLFRCWLSGVYPIVGIFMPSEIFKKHEDFWDLVEVSGISESTHLDLEFLCVLHAIWYAGSLSISIKGLRQWFPHASRAQLCTRFHDHAIFSLLLGSFNRDITLYRLGALVLLQSIPIAEEDPTQSSLYLSLIIRLAFNMGLHREPTLFDLSVAEEGFRRKLWWQIIQLELSNVVASGYPSQISEKFCDTRVVCEDRDAHTTDDGNMGSSTNNSIKSPSPQIASVNSESPSTSGFRTLSLLARGKSILACALRSIVAIHLETKQLRNADVNEMKRIMTEAGTHINDIINSIPAKGLPEMGFVPEASRGTPHGASDSDMLMCGPISSKDIAYYRTSPNDTEASWSLNHFYRHRQMAYSKWARITLSMLVDKLHCVAYAPFLKNTKSKLWGVGRQCALHNCHSYLRKFVSLATDPDLVPFRWAWPAMYGPLHACLIVLVDLYERPSSIEAARSRELVDMVFAMAATQSGIVGGPDGVTVQRPLREGGIEAWDMLRGLRSAAWQKAGLDPTVLWTEEDQRMVGTAAPLTQTQQIAQSLREDTIHDSRISCNRGDVPSDRDEMEQGVRYMVQLAYSQFNSDLKSNGISDSNTWRATTQPLPNNERQPRINPGRGLARREGQPKMPFPLTVHMERCSGHVASANAPPDHVFDIHNHVPRPENAPTTCASRGMSMMLQAGADLTSQAPSDIPNVPPVPSWDESGSNITVPTTHFIYKQQTNGQVNGNGSVTGHSSNVSGHDGQSLANQGFSNNIIQKGDTDMDLGFDWEKWDAVFGQYSGFTDMMEDMDALTEYVKP